MKLLSALVVDDEIHGRNNIINLLTTHCPEIVVAGTAADATEAAGKIKEHSPDVVFLDIMMPGMSGLDLLATMPDCKFATVMVTAYADFGIQAIKCGVVDYLLKPINIPDLKKCIPKIYSFMAMRKNGSAHSSEPGSIIATHAEGFSVINLKDIVYLEADGNYTTIQLVGGERMMICRGLKEFEDVIARKDFFRIQKSFFINLHHVKQYLTAEGGAVLMAGDKKIPVSRSKHDEFFEALKRFAVFP